MRHWFPPLRPTRLMLHRTRGRRGMALVVVLGVVAMLTVLAASLGLLASVARLDSHVFTARVAARYQAESAQALVTWMVLSDRAAGGAPAPVGQRAAAASPEDLARLAWRADGAHRPLTLAPALQAQYRLQDANSGWEVGSLAAVDRLAQAYATAPGSAPGGAASPALQDDLASFFDSLRDYLDGSPLRRLHGAKAADYATLGRPGAPRGGPLVDRAEVYWVPHVEALLGVPASEAAGRPPVPAGLLRVVAPQHQPALPTGQPSFFAAAPAQLQHLAGLSDAELAQVLSARRRWQQEQVPVQEGLGELYPRLASAFSFSESGVYTLVITATGEGHFTRRLTTTVDLRQLPTGGNLPQQYLCAWEYQLE